MQAAATAPKKVHAPNLMKAAASAPKKVTASSPKKVTAPNLVRVAALASKKVTARLKGRSCSGLKEINSFPTVAPKRAAVLALH